MRAGRGRTVTAGSVAVVAGVAVTMAVAGPAQAAWTAAWKVSANGWTADDSPRVAVDRQGDALLAWRACDTTTPNCYYRIQARLKSANGTVGPVRNLTPEGAGVTWPELDAGDNGDAAVVWEQDGHVAGRRVSAGGTLVGNIQRLSTSAPATNPSVAAGPSGLVMAVWSEVRNGSWQTVARRLRTDGTVGPAIMLGGGSAEKPAIAVDRYGQFVIAWVRGYSVVARRIRPDGMSPERVLTEPIAASAGFGMVRVGVDRDGDALISYRSGGGARPQVWVNRWSRTSTPAAPMRVSASTDNVGFHHALALDMEGDAMLVWTRYDAEGRIAMLGRRLPRTGGFGAVSGLGLHDRPDLTLDDDGDGMLVFHSPSAPAKAKSAGARLITRAGAFGAVRTLTSDGRVPQVDARPNYRFTVIWQQAAYPYAIHSVAGP